MRVALVVPPFDFARKLYGQLRSRAFHNEVPLGPLMIAAYLREAGHEVCVIDAAAELIDEDATIRRLREFGAELVGVTSSSVIWRSADALATRVKRDLGVPVIVGGPHATEFPEHAMRNPAIDAAVRGEGEETALELIGRLAAGRDFAGVPGVARRGPEGVVLEPPRPPNSRLDDMPLPAYDLARVDLYQAPPMRVRNTPAVYMEISRGCGYAQCAYCTTAIGLKQPYHRHSAKVAADKTLALREVYGAREVAFVDEDFVVGEAWIHEFCAALRERGNPVTWTCYVRGSQVNAEMFRAMAASGCHQVLMGVEVLDDAVLASLNKDLTVGTAARAVEAAHAAGISMIALMMVGVEAETPEISARSARLATEMGFDVAVFAIYHPPPKSPTWNALGLTPDDFVDGFNRYRKVVYVPPGYASERAVERAWLRAYRNFYLSPEFLGRAARRFLRDPAMRRAMAKAAWALAQQTRPRFLLPG